MQETLTDVEKRLVEAEEVTSEPVEDPELQAGGSCVMGDADYCVVGAGRQEPGCVQQPQERQE